MAKQWSAEWKSSKNPSKQRKYRENAEYHHRKKLLNAHLDDDLQDKVGTGSLPLREGDKVEVMRGDFRGSTGEVEEVDTEEQKIYVNGVERETVGGSETSIALRPSNLRITALELEDDRRLEKYEVSEEDREEIQVEEEPEEEEDTMEDEEASEEEPEDAVEDEAGEPEGEEEQGEEVDYEGVVSGTVDEVKEAVEEEGLDPEKVLEAEQTNKDRVTLTEWLQNRVEEDE